VIDFLEETFAARPRAHWEAFLAELDVCWAPVNDLRTGLDLEQVRTRGMVLVDEDGREYLGAPLKFAEEPPRPALRSPEQGGDTASVLAELGYDAAAVARLREGGVV
jgi:crotonobetainyl-CoA:carnitine CoA-transferase CaiB-like acyl-CoA transferase